MNKQLRKSCADLKKQCKTNSQRIAFNKLIKTFAGSSAKIVYIAKEHRGIVSVYVGTMETLVSQVFGYTLECGNSWNCKINRHPKSEKELILALNKSVDETQGGYSRDHYFATTKDEAQSKGWKMVSY